MRKWLRNCWWRFHEHGNRNWSNEISSGDFKETNFIHYWHKNVNQVYRSTRWPKQTRSATAKKREANFQLKFPGTFSFYEFFFFFRLFIYAQNQTDSMYRQLYVSTQSFKYTLKTLTKTFSLLWNSLEIKSANIFVWSFATLQVERPSIATRGGKKLMEKFFYFSHMKVHWNVNEEETFFSHY